MVKDNVPSQVWDYALVYEARILSMIARGLGLERMTGETVNITEWLDFSFWDRIWFHDDPEGSTGPTLGRWLGVSHRVGSSLCYFVIKANIQVLSRTTVQHVTEEDMAKEGVRSRIKKFDKDLADRLDDSNFQLSHGEEIYEDTPTTE